MELLVTFVSVIVLAAFVVTDCELAVITPRFCVTPLNVIAPLPVTAEIVVATEEVSTTLLKVTVPYP